MVFYFTGTGNSLYAASRIAEAQGDQLYSIAKLMDQKKDRYHYELEEDEILGFVFPVFAWAPPRMVLEFIKKLEVTRKSNDTEKPYAFSLCTCGDEEGRTSEIIRKALAAEGLSLSAVFSLRMPNNYIIGFDTDSKEVEAEKLKAADLMLTEISKVINGRQANVNLTIPGRFPILKSTLVNALFNRFAMNTRSFSANDDCTGCGICEKVCPVNTIKVDGKPVWGKSCTQCLGCINRCPVQAIQYGKGTIKKGRYHHPEIDRLEKLI